MGFDQCLTHPGLSNQEEPSKKIKEKRPNIPIEIRAGLKWDIEGWESVGVECCRVTRDYNVEKDAGTGELFHNIFS